MGVRRQESILKHNNNEKKHTRIQVYRCLADTLPGRIKWDHCGWQEHGEISYCIKLRQASVTLSLTWSRAEKPAYSALISGFEHLLGIIMEKLCFYWLFSIISPKLCFFSWIRAEFRMKYALPTRLRWESLYYRCEKICVDRYQPLKLLGAGVIVIMKRLL